MVETVPKPENDQMYSREKRARRVADFIRECDGAARVEIQDTYEPPRVLVECDGGIGIPDDVSDLLDTFGMTLVTSETFYDDGMTFVTEVVEEPTEIMNRELRNLGTSVGIAIPPDALDRADMQAYDNVEISARRAQIILTRNAKGDTPQEDDET
jgi:hypothetical protein